MIFQGSRIWEFIALISIAILIQIMIQRSLKGTIPKLRLLPAVSAIEEAVGRAIEGGRPVMAIPGDHDIDNPKRTSSNIAGLGILKHVADTCVRLGARLLVPLQGSMMIPMARQILRESYIKAGKEEEFDEDNVWFVSNVTSAFSSGVIATMWRENIGAFIFVGYATACSITLAESAYNVGAMSIGGTDQTGNLPFIVLCMDYSLMGEEIYAASAYISEDPVLSGSISARDIIKMFMLFAIPVLMVLFLAGINIADIFLGR